MKYGDYTDEKYIYHRMYLSILKGEEGDRKFLHSTWADSHIIDCAMRLMDRRVARCNALRSAKDVKKFIIKQREIAESVRQDFEKQ